MEANIGRNKITSIGTGRLLGKEKLGSKPNKKSKIIKELRNFIEKNVVSPKNNIKLPQQKVIKNPKLLIGSFSNNKRDKSKDTYKKQHIKSLNENLTINNAC